MQNILKVFISYKHQDSAKNEWVERFYSDLRDAGIDAIIDKYKIKPGESISNYMVKEITDSNHFLFIMTTESIKSVDEGEGALAFEMQIANSIRLSGKKDFIIPILREGKKSSIYLLDTKYLDFREDNKYQENILELIMWMYNKKSPPLIGKNYSKTIELFTDKFINNELDEYFSIEPVAKEVILPISLQFVECFPDLSNKLIKASTNIQFTVFTLFNEIFLEIDYLDLENDLLIKGYIHDYFSAILSGEKKLLHTIGSAYIRDVIEKRHLEFVKLLITYILNKDDSNTQLAFHAPNSDWQIWGLFSWGRIYYPNWNKNVVYGSIFQVPIEIINNFEYLGFARNNFSHVSNVDENKDYIYIIRDVFLRSFKIFSWLNSVHPLIINPFISLKKIKIIMSQMDNEISKSLSEIKFNKDQIKKLNDKTNSQYKDVLKLLSDISKGKININENTINSIEGIIFPLIDPKKKEKAEE